MEKNDEAVITKIGEAFGDRIGDLVARCIVKSVTVTDVDEENNVALVTIFDGDEPLQVPLQFLNVGNAVIKVVPAKDSTAAIVGLDGNINKPVFISYTEVEQVYVQVGESSVQITSDAVTFNGGENKGLVLAESLCDRLNTIEDDINSLKQIFSSWAPQAMDGGATLQTLASTWAGQTLQKTAVGDIENEKIIQ